MQVTKIETTKIGGNLAVAGSQISNPTNVAGTVLLDFAQMASGALGASIALPAGANITDIWFYSTGTGSLWGGTPNFFVSIVPSGGSNPVTGNLVNGVSNTITAFGQVQSFAKSTWVTYQNALNVASGSTINIYTETGSFVIPTTAACYFAVEYYITP